MNKEAYRARVPGKEYLGGKYVAKEIKGHEVLVNKHLLETQGVIAMPVEIFGPESKVTVQTPDTLAFTEAMRNNSARLWEREQVKQRMQSPHRGENGRWGGKK